MSGYAVYTPGARTLSGMTPQQDYSVYVIERPTAVPDPGGTLATVQDRIMRTTSLPASDNNCTYGVSPAAYGGQNPKVSWSAATPWVATITPSGDVSRVSDGLATFVASGLYGSRQYTRQMARTGGGTTTTFSSYVAGSLARHITDQMMALVAGKTPSDSTLLNYSVRSGDYANPTIARNSSNFAASVDLSGMSVWRSENNNYGYWPCAAVTSRHVITASHVSGGGLFGYAWLTPGGSVVKANSISCQAIPGTDLQVNYLDQALPASIKRFKVLPANYRTYLPSATSYWVPALSKRQKVGDSGGAWIETPTYDAMRVLPTRLADILDSLLTYQHFAEVPQIGQLDPADPLYAWETELHTGDSGGPHFLLINGEAVLLGHYAETRGCPHIADYATQVETAMNALATAAGDATSYSLSRVNLSGFSAF